MIWCGAGAGPNPVNVPKCPVMHLQRDGHMQIELFKTTAHFDTKARHPDWLGSDSPGRAATRPATARLTRPNSSSPDKNQ